MTYFNTVSEQGKLLKKYEAQTDGQEKKVLIWFRSHPTREITPWDVHEIVFAGTKVPIGSARRATTNLEKAGGIEETGEKVKSGPYNRNCLLYRLRRKPSAPIQEQLI